MDDSYHVPTRTRVGFLTLNEGGAVAHREVAPVHGVDAVHYGFEYGAVGRGVGESVVVDEVVYHLVDDGVVDHLSRQVEACGDAQLEVGVLATTVGVGEHPRDALSEKCLGVAQPYGYARQPPTKHEPVVEVKTFLDILHGGTHYACKSSKKSGEWKIKNLKWKMGNY